MGVPVRVNPRLATQACLTLDGDGRPRIILRELCDEAHFAVAHELGHWALAHIACYRPPNEEMLANRIAGAICAPTSVVRRVARAEPRDLARQLRPLARTTGISQTAAHLRLAEVLEDERAVLTAEHGHIMVRSQGAFPWGEDSAREAIVRRDPRMQVAKLRGGIDHGRLALRAL